jgi:hypothetical protein
MAWPKRSAPQNKRWSGCCHILRRIIRTTALSFVSSPPPTLRQTLLQNLSHKAPPKLPICMKTLAPTSQDGTSSTIKRRKITTIHPPIYVNRDSATHHPSTPAHHDEDTNPARSRTPKVRARLQLKNARLIILLAVLQTWVPRNPEILRPGIRARPRLGTYWILANVFKKVNLYNEFLYIGAQEFFCS